MRENVERLREELSDLLTLIRRVGGGVVFEEFPGAFEEQAEAPEKTSATPLIFLKS